MNFPDPISRSKAFIRVLLGVKIHLKTIASFVCFPTKIIFLKFEKFKFTKNLYTLIFVLSQYLYFFIQCGFLYLFLQIYFNASLHYWVLEYFYWFLYYWRYIFIHYMILKMILSIIGVIVHCGCLWNAIFKKINLFLWVFTCWARWYSIYYSQNMYLSYNYMRTIYSYEKGFKIIQL